MEGRLAEMNDGLNPPVYKVTYRYDGFGRRLLETVTNNGATSHRQLQLCGSQPCQARPVGGGPRIKSYLATSEYVFANGGNPAQKLITFTDQLGSARDVLDADTGRRVGALDYQPYGTTHDSFGTLPDYRYAGLLWDGNIGLYASATRFYDPGTTRWMTRDWIGERGGFILYGYVNANPINGKDPSGTVIHLIYGCAANPLCVEVAVTGALAIGSLFSSAAAEMLEALPPNGITRIEKTGAKAIKALTTVTRYEVGAYNALKARSVP